MRNAGTPVLYGRTVAYLPGQRRRFSRGFSPVKLIGKMVSAISEIKFLLMSLQKTAVSKMVNL
ncbi:hypothetical protein CSA57_04895 [candidate division KSB3 bacterium]|nr:MAG: hypothetical protein CSA57_04895 [candidate division KSB3 bacterium]